MVSVDPWSTAKEVKRTSRKNGLKTPTGNSKNSARCNYGLKDGHVFFIVYKRPEVIV